jgi:hypothetical protein
MRADEFLTEYREAYLYHATSIPSAIRIWRDDVLRGGTGPTGKGGFKGVSTTRSYNYALGYMKGTSYDDQGAVIFWIDQDSVKRDLGRRRLKGYDWFTDNDPDDVSGQFQRRSEIDDTDRFETVITQGGLKPFRKYIVKIEVWLPKSDSQDNNAMDVYLQKPEDRAVWNALLADPRTDVKAEAGIPRKYQGAPIRAKVQYDPQHPMYGGREY